MHPASTLPRPFGPDLAIVTGFIQVLVAFALLFLPLSKSCFEYLRYPPVRADCTAVSLLEEFGLSFNGPVPGVGVLLAAGVVLMVGSRIKRPGLRALVPWIAVALNGLGLALAWLVCLWFVPTTACALWAAILLWRRQGRRAAGNARRPYRGRHW